MQRFEGDRKRDGMQQNEQESWKERGRPR